MLAQFSDMQIIEKSNDDALGKTVQQLVTICYSHRDKIGFTRVFKAVG